MANNSAVSAKNELRNEIVKRVIESGSKIVTVPVSALSYRIYMYNRDLGIYETDHVESLVSERIEDALGEDCTRHDVLEAIAKVQRNTFVDSNFFEKTGPELVPVGNGVINVLTGELLRFDDAYHFLNKIDVFYDSKAECPKIDKFLHEVLGSEEAIQSIYEFVGYCLYRGYPVQKSFLFVGEGANGKSTLIKLMEKFLGARNVSHIPFQFLNGRFNTYVLYGKLANFFPDLPEQALNDVAVFQAITGGDTIDAEIKYVQKRQTFTNYAKPCFSCNIIPKVNVDTTAFWRRWAIFQFPNKFEGPNCNPKILEELCTPEELTGLLNRALEGLKRLLKNNAFSSNPLNEETRMSWIAGSDSLKLFIEKECSLDDPDATIAKNEFYRLYRNFCVKEKVRLLSHSKVGRDLRENYAVLSSRDSDETRIWCYKGIQIKPDLDPTVMELKKW